MSAILRCITDKPGWVHFFALVFFWHLVHTTMHTYPHPLDVVVHHLLPTSISTTTSHALHFVSNFLTHLWSLLCCMTNEQSHCLIERLTARSIDFFFFSPSRHPNLAFQLSGSLPFFHHC
ncbi:uncharacterized protein BO97DRAFT_151358 [Aspergillus homomorphus CBS 101889]|uniref:Uncharacterized protein n=1 Tax=Aspergillus homomorphus (strain CBS 101889) TaxID=1450537 RepID=A0A395HQT1_ASPHC|nr:hypothetical protein BO97DRAFT_151358 [Aspergillus homomorphus CBS 101889]RAL09956.1 hypothetical protein BO97DRAFT_151358 [Aspergillus homomorphus CBS 101889]